MAIPDKTPDTTPDTTATGPGTQSSHARRKRFLLLLLLLLLCLLPGLCHYQKGKDDQSTSTPASTQSTAAGIAALRIVTDDKPVMDLTREVVVIKEPPTLPLQVLGTAYHCRKNLCRYEVDLLNIDKRPIIATGTVFALSQTGKEMIHHTQHHLGKKTIAISMQGDETRKLVGALTVQKEPVGITLLIVEQRSAGK